MTITINITTTSKYKWLAITGCLAASLCFTHGFTSHQFGLSGQLRAPWQLYTSTATKPPNETPRVVAVEEDPPFKDNDLPNIVMVMGFESFNRQLYQQAANKLCNLAVFADTELRTVDSMGSITNPKFVNAMKNADAFVGSLIFDYDDVLAVKEHLEHIQGPRFIFECATELMMFNRVSKDNIKIHSSHYKSSLCCT